MRFTPAPSTSLTQEPGVHPLIDVKNTCTYAAENGYLSVLKFAHENGCMLDRSTTAPLAMRAKSLGCFKYICMYGVLCAG